MRIVEFQLKRSTMSGVQRGSHSEGDYRRHNLKLREQRDRQAASAVSEALGVPFDQALDLIGRTVRLRECQFGVLCATLLKDMGVIPILGRSVRFVAGDEGVVDLTSLPVPALRPTVTLKNVRMCYPDLMRPPERGDRVEARFAVSFGDSPASMREECAVAVRGWGGVHDAVRHRIGGVWQYELAFGVEFRGSPKLSREDVERCWVAGSQVQV